MLITVVMPVYNEAQTVRDILELVTSNPLEKEIIIIDDGSTDGTVNLLHDLLNARDKKYFKPWIDDIRLIEHPVNRGKGAAVRSGLEAARGDVIIVQDADLEYDPDDYSKLLRPILSGRSEVVYGSRFLGEHKAMFYWHQVGNKFLTFVTNILYNTTLTDMETCYKCFTKEAIKGMRLRSNRFEIEPELTARLLKRGYRIYEVPISYNGREYRQGKKITWKDGLSALKALIYYRIFD
ncbi:MAG: glycosyltransferase family 2 protein [bacterium]|jgi:glycosyltransferase involved in cell wall biosynthesis|nr:glycosyltransferase family 2 protein [bacterium]MDD3805509.1 glycosyltransferase family 2 protein [bacterium]MDD4153067.1 glycosyltransferase family 2 protein [bacterium]MDD4558536.1 glycosyltransferase family 2 protein [bacterium]